MTFILSLFCPFAWADQKKTVYQRKPIEWITLVHRQEFSQTYKKSWEEATSRERKQFLSHLKSIVEQAQSSRQEPVPVQWILSQPQHQSSKIQIARKFPIGYKPNFSRGSLLSKRFVQRSGR